MRYLSIFALLAALIIGINCKADFDAQFDAVENVDDQRKISELAIQQLAIKRQDEKRKKEKEKELARHQENEKRDRQRSHSAEIKKKTVENERLADKKRSQSYEDKIREIKLRKMEAEIVTLETKAERTDDYIDAELKTSEAATDVVQSVADRNRQEGKASIKRAENPLKINVKIYE